MQSRRIGPPSRALLWLVILLITVACGQQEQRDNQATAATNPTQPAASAATEPAAEASTVAGPTQTVRPTATVVPEGHFVNPVFRNDFADPGILFVDGVYYAYATNASSFNVPVAQSTDLVEWERGRDALPVVPAWAKVGFTWAPEAIDVENGYALYYTARDRETDRQCIGVATSDKPEGPYRDNNESAFICQVEMGGSIDASPFRDEDGKLYLYWKNDGNCCGFATWLYVQELTPDGLSLVGEPVQLVRNDHAWEGQIVEAPTMWRQDGSYYLFFSGNLYSTLEYAVGYATCESPLGPCEDSPDNPILETSLERPPVVGPGHQTVVRDPDGDTWMVYHAWEMGPAGKTNRRFVWIDKLVWEDAKPAVLGPTTAPQPAPSEE